MFVSLSNSIIFEKSIILMAAFSTPIAQVTAGSATIYFTLVVVLTMLSTYFFDTRILWQKEREKQ